MEKNTQNPQQPEPIPETALTVPKKPWWKIALEIVSYIATAAGGAVVALLVSNAGGDDEESTLIDSKPEE